MPQTQQKNTPSSSTQTDSLSSIFAKIEKIMTVMSPRGLGLVGRNNGKNEVEIEKIDPGSVAAKSGLKKGDTIIGFEGTWKDGASLLSAMSKDKDGNFSLRIRNENGTIRNVSISEYKPLAPFGTITTSASIGRVELKNGTIIQPGHVPIVGSVAPKSNAELLGLKAGDHILSLKRSGLADPIIFGGDVGNKTFVEIVRSLRPGEKLQITVLRDGEAKVLNEDKRGAPARALQTRKTIPTHESFRI
jgi:S1-C subfamily serine protease